MEEEPSFGLASIFAAVEDPRIEQTKLHRLVDILMIAGCGMICGADGWVEIEEFGKAKQAWFHSWLVLPNGIPSHDTFGRVFARIDPTQFETCFLNWVQSVSEEIKGVIAVDGKTLRRSHNRAEGKKALHLVSAWASENRMVLAQLATEEKSNEITAIPALLRQLAVAGCLVTIDAMGTQAQIASQIIEQEVTMPWPSKRIKGRCMKACLRRLPSRSRTSLRTSNMSRIAQWKRGMAAWRFVSIGRLPTQRSSRFWMRRNVGKRCKALEWCGHSGV